ncbi:MAG TPA: hypothetical protein ENG92_05980 [Thiolapillus brandeum]|uniref:Bacterial repeat domain-containing protein n=1 Tax=Thiolapillus brandeum TaxID=1076588 RepID=A0A831JSL5_9GAMM|nr:hypothetical protein [Thiolapillus brandeum]
MKLDVSWEPPEGGSVELSRDSTVSSLPGEDRRASLTRYYYAGDIINTYARAADGYRFHHWEGDVKERENKNALLMLDLYRDIKLKAVFVPVTDERMTEGTRPAPAQPKPNPPTGNQKEGTERISLYTRTEPKGAAGGKISVSMPAKDPTRPSTTFSKAFTAAPDLYRYPTGAVVEVRAHPKRGFSFQYFEVIQNGRKKVMYPKRGSRSLRLTMKGGITVTAVFFRQRVKLSLYMEATSEVSNKPLVGGEVIVSPKPVFATDKKNTRVAPGRRYGENRMSYMRPVILSYNADSRVRIEAYPNLGFEFVRWSGAINSKEKVITLRMNSDKKLTAHFRSRVEPPPKVEGAPRGGRPAKKGVPSGERKVSHCPGVGNDTKAMGKPPAAAEQFVKNVIQKSLGSLLSGFGAPLRIGGVNEENEEGPGTQLASYNPLEGVSAWQTNAEHPTFLPMAVSGIFLPPRTQVMENPDLMDALDGDSWPSPGLTARIEPASLVLGVRLLDKSGVRERKPAITGFSLITPDCRRIAPKRRLIWKVIEENLFKWNIQFWRWHNDVLVEHREWSGSKEWSRLLGSGDLPIWVGGDFEGISREVLNEGGWKLQTLWTYQKDGKIYSESRVFDLQGGDDKVGEGYPLRILPTF